MTPSASYPGKSFDFPGVRKRRLAKVLHLLPQFPPHVDGHTAIGEATAAAHARRHAPVAAI